MTTNPRYFFSYAKRFAKVASNIGPLKDKDGIIHQDPKTMADILQRQYVSVFSDPSSPDLKDPKFAPSEFCIEDINFSTEDIIDAINEIDPYSATSDQDILAKVIKECKENICVPIDIIWKRSFHSETIPPACKTQFISPIFKKGYRTYPENYRPISLTSHFIKIFERVIRQRMVKFLEENSILSSTQHGFRKGRSCLTQLLAHYDRIMQNLNSGQETDVIYLDYAKAFDKVDHNTLLKKLHRYGIRGKLHNWIKEFLINRTQTVVIDGHHSVYENVKSGVPQGSVLGPILFILYINDLNAHVKYSTIGSFADDTRASKAISTIKDTQELQSDLNSIVEWSQHNNMKLHEKKFEFLCYRIKQFNLLEELPFSSEYTSYNTPNGHTLQPKPIVKDLGVFLSEDYTWTYHINTIAKDARKMAAWVLGVFRNRSTKVMLQLYKSMVRSRLEYCCPLWNPHRVTDIQTLEEIQRSFTRKIHGLSQMNYWERTKKLGLMSLQRRRERYVIITIFKIINDMIPNDIMIDWYSHPRLGVRVKIPPFNHRAPQYASSLLESSFKISGAKLWNMLPASVNTNVTLEKFKTSLSTFLKEYPDEPPIRGYHTQNSNSLTDWSTTVGRSSLK